MLSQYIIQLTDSELVLEFETKGALVFGNGNLSPHNPIHLNYIQNVCFLNGLLPAKIHLSCL